MQIPIKNIYYLLCYAWDKLEEKDRVKISIDDTTQLSDLFAKVLINVTKVLIKRGIDRNYVDSTCEVAGIKGKLLLTKTLKSNLYFRKMTICAFDEFSANSLLNQILVTVIQQLIKTKNLNNDLKLELLNLRRMLPDIHEIVLTASTFKQIRLNRNNRFYEFVINVCQIIYDCLLPSEEQGKYNFSDFTRDDRKMNRLFEGFIRNFYRIEQQKFLTVKKETIKWQFYYHDEVALSYIPEMVTDITLENDREKVIIETKYYLETMVVNYGKEKIKSANLFQLFSYLLNQRNDSSKAQNATGILLYPTIEKDYDLDFIYQSHKILIRTVNLNTDWRNINKRLLQIIGVG